MPQDSIGGDLTASERITQQITGLNDWRGPMLARLRRLILEAVPDMEEGWKWDTGVWSQNGMVCSAGAFKNHVKLNFFKGASLSDPNGLFNAGLDAKTTRSIDFSEGDTLDEAKLKDLIRAATAVNAVKKRWLQPTRDEERGTPGMCGRFTMTYPDAHLLAEELGVPVESLGDYAPHYNIAPTDPHYVLRIKNEVRELLPARWGLVNTWAKDAKRAAAQINARAETIETSRAFREAFTKRRCIVPATGFYEWDRTARSKGSAAAPPQPYLFQRADGHPLLFAGLQESWQPRPGEWQRTFTIITTAPSDDVSFIHDRMPLILDDNAADLWMFGTTPVEQLRPLLRPAANGTLAHAPVSTRVNKVGNDDASLVEPTALAARLL